MILDIEGIYETNIRQRVSGRRGSQWVHAATAQTGLEIRISHSSADIFETAKGQEICSGGQVTFKK